MRRSIDVSSVLSSDDLADYDIISDGNRSLESSIADLGHLSGRAEFIQEPPPSQAARDRFGTPTLQVEDIQAYVQKAIDPNGDNTKHTRVRVYVDGLFDPFHAGHALQLRQAKLSFPSVHLMVGVFPDDTCERHNSPTTIPHVERCELLRHCRWADEIIPEAPWRLDESFLRAHRIDYVAINEGASVDPIYDKERVKGYDLVKSIGKAIPTRRTSGLARPVSHKGAGTQTPTGSRNNTIKGMPASFASKEGKAEASEIEPQPEEDPFEEPKVDEFGTGVGV